MPEPRRLTLSSAVGLLVLIAAIVACGAAAFAYTAGWFSPERLTPDKLVDAFTPPGGAPPLGHRRNHAKGICFTGVFEANGAGAELSRAQAFARGQYPVLGRFNLGTPDPNAPDATVRVRGMGLMITTPDGQEWRMAMIDPPFFPVSTPQAFYDLLIASASKDPNAMPNFAKANPEIAKFGEWAKSAPWTGSLCGGAFQQPQQLHLHRQFRRGACGELVASAGGAAGTRRARRTRQTRSRLPRAGDRRAG